MGSICRATGAALVSVACRPIVLLLPVKLEPAECAELGAAARPLPLPPLTTSSIGAVSTSTSVTPATHTMHLEILLCGQNNISQYL